MHKNVKNLLLIETKIKKEINNSSINLPKIIAVSKTFSMENINPLIETGHIHFGENKVKEAENKWLSVKKLNPKIKLHMVGKLQTNKVKLALEVFDFLHSLDSYKLAEIISKHEKEKINKIKIFVQVNIGNEPQKSGISLSEVKEFVKICKNKFFLDIVGLMCLPPNNKNPKSYFMQMQNFKNELNLHELSMGMSNDYLEAINYSSTFLRIGTKIFGQRK